MQSLKHFENGEKPIKKETSFLQACFLKASLLSIFQADMADQGIGRIVSIRALQEQFLESE